MRRTYGADPLVRHALGGLRLSLFCLLLLSLFQPSAASEREPFKIAAIFSLTGIAATQNQQMVKMTQLAIDRLNSRGGIMERPVELVLLDNRSTPIGSALAARWAVAMDVVAVVGSVWSSHSLAMAPILQKAGVPMISPASTSPHLTRGRDFVFRVCFVDSFQGLAMARFARHRLGVRTAAVVSNVDEQYSVDLAGYFRHCFVKLGGEVILAEQYRREATDFSAILAKIKAQHPEVVYLPGYARDSSLFLRQARKMGIEAVFLGGDAWDEMADLAGEVIDGSYHSAAWHPMVDNRRSELLKTLYRRTYGEEIKSFNSPLAYDAVMVLAEALAQCRCTEGGDVRDALFDLENFAGATGSITFDENGDPRKKQILIIGFQERQPVLVESMVP